MAASQVQEVPEQDFAEIRRNIMCKKRGESIADEYLFVDSTFPPDQSSLTYVYSGDDKYERMVFRRPQVNLYPHILYHTPHQQMTNYRQIHFIGKGKH